MEFKARAEAYETLLHDGSTLACFSAEDQQRRKGEILLLYFMELFFSLFVADFTNRPVPRQEIRRILFEALPADCVQWAAEFERFEDISGQPLKVIETKSLYLPSVYLSTSLPHPSFPSQVFFRDGTIVTCHALIGCDGVRSRVRSQLLSDPPKYLEVLNVLGIARCTHPLVGDRITQTLDGTNRLFTKPFNADSQSNM